MPRLFKTRFKIQYSFISDYFQDITLPDITLTEILLVIYVNVIWVQQPEYICFLN